MKSPYVVLDVIVALMVMKLTTAPPLARAFVLMTTTATTTRTTIPKSIVALHAKKVVKRNNNNNKNNNTSGSSKQQSGGGGGGGGFGKSSSVASAASSVIAFSGHSGSGTKALRKVANQFDVIRKANADKNQTHIACRDVYIRSPLHSPTTFWFVGKIASVPPSSSLLSTTDNQQQQDEQQGEQQGEEQEAVNSPRWIQTALLLKRIIFEYSKDQLRPQVMGGKYAAALELWLAPADSEMDVATNKVTLFPVQRSLASSNVEITLKANEIGYNPEIYVGDEKVKGGLRVERKENGVPTKAPFEVNFSQ